MEDSVTLVYSGEDYFSRLERIISESEFEIHIQIYLFENDATGKRIISALKEAASRNVKIYLLIDGFGSFLFPTETIAALKQSGITFRFFSPFLSINSFYLGRRLHHKVIVSDSKTALIGGINIADKYRGSKTEMPWLDYAVQLNGEIVGQIQELCKTVYFKKRGFHKKITPFVYNKEEGFCVNILQNDWLYSKNEICDTYVKSIRSAENEIIIMGSYFLPGKKIIKALKKASQNKVKIKLILSGKSDLPLTKFATSYIYSKLLKYNIEIYEWELSVLHGKAAIIDGKWTTIGSFNLNNLSSYGSLEMNVEINSAEFSKVYCQELNKIIDQCQNITAESFQLKNSLRSIFVRWISYHITRGIEIIITYLPYKRFHKFF